MAKQNNNNMTSSTKSTNTKYGQTIATNFHTALNYHNSTNTSDLLYLPPPHLLSWSLACTRRPFSDLLQFDRCYLARFLSLPYSLPTRHVLSHPCCAASRTASCGHCSGPLIPCVRSSARQQPAACAPRHRRRRRPRADRVQQPHLRTHTGRLGQTHYSHTARWRRGGHSTHCLTASLLSSSLPLHCLTGSDCCTGRSPS